MKDIFIISGEDVDTAKYFFALWQTVWILVIMLSTNQTHFDWYCAPGYQNITAMSLMENMLYE